MRNRGFSKHKLSLWFSEIKYSSRAKYLGANPGNICYFQGTRETQAESLLINTSERIMTEAISGVPDDTTEVVSEDEGNMVTLEDIVVQEGVFSKGTAKRKCPFSIALSSKKPKNFSVFPTVLLTQKQERERLCCLFPGSLLEYKKEIDIIFAEETATLLESKSMRNTFKNIRILAVIKNKCSIKKPCGKNENIIKRGRGQNECMGLVDSMLH